MKKRYSRVARLGHLILVVFAGLGCTACGQVAGSMQDAKADLAQSSSNESTAHLGANAPEIQRDDQRAIVARIEAALAKDTTTTPTDPVLEPLAWSSPATGNSGIIMSLMQVDDATKLGCTDFVTSANTYTGVKAYTGRTCPDANHQQKIVDLAPFEPDTAQIN